MGNFSRLAGIGLLVGGGVLVVGAVVVGPRLFRAARPHLREGLKVGLAGYDHVLAAAAEVIEDFEDLVAEVRADMHARRAPPHEPEEQAEPDEADTVTGHAAG